MPSLKKLEIIRTDSTRDHFISLTRNDSNKYVIVLAEVNKVNTCKPFKRYILEDSVHETSTIKSGNGFDILGFNVSTIDGIKIRNDGELIKIFWNCNCFTDK